MYIQPTSEDGAHGVQLPRDYAGTAFDTRRQETEDESRESGNDTPEAAPCEETEEKEEQATPAFSPTQKRTCNTEKGRGGILSFLSNSPLLSSFLPPPRKGHEGESDLMQWIMVGLVFLLLLNDSDDDILPLLLLLLLWN